MGVMSERHCIDLSFTLPVYTSSWRKATKSSRQRWTTRKKLKMGDVRNVLKSNVLFIRHHVGAPPFTHESQCDQLLNILKSCFNINKSHEKTRTRTSRLPVCLRHWTLKQPGTVVFSKTGKSITQPGVNTGFVGDYFQQRINTQRVFRAAGRCEWDWLCVHGRNMLLGTRNKIYQASAAETILVSSIN